MPTPRAISVDAKNKIKRGAWYIIGRNKVAGLRTPECEIKYSREVNDVVYFQACKTNGGIFEWHDSYVIYFFTSLCLIALFWHVIIDYRLISGKNKFNFLNKFLFLCNITRIYMISVLMALFDNNRFNDNVLC